VFLVYDLHYPVSPSHAEQVVLLALRQAQRSLIVFLHVHRHVTHALVLPEVPEAQVAVVTTGNQLKALRAKEDGGD
jgi:hypothetical protein